MNRGRPVALYEKSHGDARGAAARELYDHGLATPDGFAPSTGGATELALAACEQRRGGQRVRDSVCRLPKHQSPFRL